MRDAVTIRFRHGGGKFRGQNHIDGCCVALDGFSTYIMTLYDWLNHWVDVLVGPIIQMRMSVRRAFFKIFFFFLLLLFAAFL